MNIAKLEKYINYKPVFDKDPQFLVDEIIKEAKKYITQEEEIKEIQRAYEYARDAHNNSINNTRQSWEPYIVHPVKATQFLMKINPEIASIQACLLHDVIEDTEITYEMVKKEFWEEVADLCTHLEKVSKVKYKKETIDKNTIGEVRQLETLKKTFLAMWKDLRVIFIKLADRIHNIQTLHYHPREDKRRRIAEETLKIYVPIAQRLWLSVFQWYLENWSFRVLDEKEFNRIFLYLKKKYWEWAQYTPKWVEMLSQILNEENEVKYINIKWRLKSPYRIWTKLVKYQTNDIEKILDILAFRIITDTIWNCYNILWIIHKNYTPIIKKIKDYISIPKNNWYSSLHTTILWMFSFPVEIQIRTYEMDKVAEFWVAAHFSYVEKWSEWNVSEKQSMWIKKMQEIVSSFQSSAIDEKDRFKSEMEIEILEKNIFVYTPNWDIKELPQGCTVLDFAFRIHSDIWLSFNSAIVNNQFVPIDYKLKNWDIVKIKSFKNKLTASSSWIKFLHTPSAKAKLNKYLRNKEKERYINLWTSILNEKLKDYQLPLIGTRKDLIWKKYKNENYERLMFNIVDKQINVTKIIKEIYWSEVVEQFLNNKKKDTNIEHENNNLENYAIIDTDKKLDYIICPECKAKPWEKIICKVGKDWMKIHWIGCKALNVLSYKKLLEAHWKWQNPEKYILKLTIDLVDKPWILLRLLSVFSDLNVNIWTINVDKSNNEWYTQVNVELQFFNPSKIDFVLKELKNKENYVRIIRKEII